MTLLALLISAVFAAAPGYVVKAEDGKVFLDFGAASGATAGTNFTIYKEGPELKHPVTGESLGREEETLAQGVIAEVREKYSVGTVTSTEGLKPGQRARLGSAPTSGSESSRQSSGNALTDGAARKPKWKSDAFDFEITAMAVADLDADGKADTVVSDGRKVLRFGYPPKPKEKGPEYEPRTQSVRLYSLEAGDLNGNGRAEVFASLYNDTFSRFETLVLELDEKGAWAKLEEFPGVVRSHQNGDGASVLAVQRVVDDKTFPYSSIYPLVFQDGKYAAGKGAIRPKRVDWINDFNIANLDGTKPAELSLTSTELLRVQFDKGQWKTSEAYGQTPLRVRWANRVLSFRPHMPARYEGGRFAGLYLIRNKAALGGLAQPFGLFTGGELVRKDWNGVSLSDGWTGTLGGYASSLRLLPSELVVAVVGTAGKSSIWTYDP